MEMVEQRPANHHELSLITGIGQRKLELYGDDFLAVLAEYSATSVAKPVDEKSQQTLELFKTGYPLAQIAQQLSLSIEGVYNHLAKFIELGLIESREVLSDYSSAEIADLENVLINLTEQQRRILKPIHEQLGGAYSYGVLRCIRAEIERRISQT